MAEDEFENRSEKPLLLLVDGRLYDVALFAKKHPGGEKVLERLAGGDVTGFMKGEERVLGVKHEHSAAAYEILKRYDVERIQKGDPVLDSKHGMLFKVGELGEDYWTWIHQPYEGTLRLFDSDMMEMLTRTVWWVVPAFWMPVVLFFSGHSLQLLYGSLGVVLGSMSWAVMFSLGFLTWTLTEYLLHRFVFHWKPNTKSYSQLLLHFLLHGLHHKTPMDESRLVFPPAPAIPIVAFFYLIYSSILPWSVFCSFGSGKLFGYICYDMVHYYLHHGSPLPTTNFHYKKVYHHNHHFKDFDVAFGISTQIWDHVFGTVGVGPL